MSSKRITIDPITRLEGHGKIDIFLDDQGQVEKAYFQIPELRGFEKFAEGRLAEDMPQITSRICGVCRWLTTWRPPRRWTACSALPHPPRQREIRGAGLQRLHGGRPRVARLLPGRAGLYCRPLCPGRPNGHSRRHRQGSVWRLARRLSARAIACGMS